MTDETRRHIQQLEDRKVITEQIVDAYRQRLQDEYQRGFWAGYRAAMEQAMKREPEGCDDCGGGDL